MDLGIAGKWALVGGASKGLGWGCAAALAAEGVNVVMVARGAEALQAAAQALSEQHPRVRIVPVAADITTEAGRSAIWSAAGGPGQAFDIVVTNAGGPPPGDFRNWDRAAWLAAIDANMLTPIELIKATVDGMAERGFGRVVNITSSAVKAPIDILGLSNGARSGLTGFVAGLARSPLAAKEPLGAGGGMAACLPRARGDCRAPSRDDSDVVTSHPCDHDELVTGRAGPPVVRG